MTPMDSMLAAAQAVKAGARPVPSPCISVCQMNPVTGWCTGCYRTMGEIAAWSQLPDDGKRVVWAHIEQRVAQLKGTTA